MKKTLFLLLILLAAAIPACSGKPAAPSKPVYRIGTDPVDVQLLELDCLNIPYWVESGVRGRVLVRFSAIDGLKPVDEEAVSKLDALKDKGEISGLIAAAAKSTPDKLYNSASTVYLAHRMGLVDEVWWVVPTFHELTEDNLRGFKNYLKQIMPDQAEDIDRLKLEGTVARGVINGVPLHITALDDLPNMDKPVLLSIDMSFLSSLYQNEKNTRFLSFLAGFFKTLQGVGVSSDLVTLSTSNIDGAVPYKFRFLARYLQKIFKEPGMIDNEPPKLWAERGEAWKVEQKSPREAIPVYKSIIKEFPKDAATDYDLSNAYFLTGDMDGCRRALAEAARLDPGYRPAYGEYATRLAQAGKDELAKSFTAEPAKP